MSIEGNSLKPLLMIQASAGSGKTYQLSNRIIGKVAVMGDDPERMIALTFTRKAAGEFADELMDKLQQAATNRKKEEQLQEQIGGSFDAQEVLEHVVKALPRMQLGTMDSFFSQIVRSFQYELGLSGGDFELIEGVQLKLAMGELIREVLSEMLEDGDGEDFVHAFRRATRGSEESRVARNLEAFVDRWHNLWKSSGDDAYSMTRFGGRNHFPDLPEVGQWEREKDRIVSALRAELELMEGWSDKRQKKALADMCQTMEDHTIGSGVLGDKGIFSKVLGWIESEGEPILHYYKDFTLSAPLALLLREVVELVANCECAAAIERTEGIGRLIRRVNVGYDRRIKNRSLLSFDDIKVLMASWQSNEEARLQRELVDFRLDGSYDHWFLDEFQDTSLAQWEGLVTLLDEAASGQDQNRSLFVIGDKKQAIYGWRGGEVTLFDKVQQRYEHYGMETIPMDKSYRSCQAVLDLVNEVCCNNPLIGELFGPEVMARWDCNLHTSAVNESGESRVDVCPKEEMNERLVERLQKLGIHERKLSCGILVRKRKEVQEVADFLRLHGFDVVEDGRRKPMEDNPVGVALNALIQWLADPADRHARGLVELSPLNRILRSRFGDDEWTVRWEALLNEAHVDGFAGMIRQLLAPLRENLPSFGQRRVEDILVALQDYDASGSGTVRGVKAWLEALETSQPPTDASVQVMTIHQSKGLGFDVVILPNLNDETIPKKTHYGMIKSREGWVLQPPAFWVRCQIETLRRMEQEWENDQRYEAMCLLYVALTRARQGLYILLPEEPENRLKNPEEAESRASPANLVRRSISTDHFGNAEWAEGISLKEPKQETVEVELGPALPLLGRSTPSATKTSDGRMSFRSGAGMQIGSEVHALLEGISWLEPGEYPRMPRSQSGQHVEEALADPKIHALFENSPRDVELYREQPLEVIQDGKWLSGIVDRMHVCRGDDGAPRKITIIDYKTDAASAEEITAKYTAQMRCYQKAIVDIFGVGKEQVKCLIISTRNKAVIDLS